MIVAVTGHTKGIGYAVAQALSSDHQLLGYSRSTGFDISVAADRDRILQQIVEADVFVNNAWHETGQCSMFELVYNAWRSDCTKTIVNINSKVKYNGYVNDSYIISKKQLYALSLQCIRDNSRQCRIINVNPGFVDTGLISDTNKQKLSGKMMQVDDLAHMIKWCLEQPQHIEIAELSVWLTGS
jgi:NADP-dependent 3-hydroxy acid dehydrogenase YdfG